MNNIVILALIVFSGYFYYTLAVSRAKGSRQIAFAMKIAFLTLSFLLTFLKSDFIVFGNTFAFGGRSAVMMIIAIEIADAFVDRKNSK